MFESLASLFNALSDLVTPLLNFVKWIFPIKVHRLHDGEKGVITTWGRVRSWRTSEVGPGVALCFIFEELDVVQGIGNYVDLTEQMLMTADKKLITINGRVMYEVVNVKSAILENEDIDEFVSGFCMNAIREYAIKNELAEIVDSEKLSNKLAVNANKKLKRRGVRIEEFMITDLRPHEVTLICDTIRDVFHVNNPWIWGGFCNQS